MDFRLDADQVELQQTVARFFADRFPLESVGAREGGSVDRPIWEEMADLGIFSLLDDDGGLGAVEATLVFEQVGSRLVPGPLLWTTLAAPFVDAVSSGERLVGGVLAATVADGAADVEHAGDIDILLVVGEEDVVAHAVADLDAPEPLVPLDPLTPIGRVRGLGEGRPIGCADDARSLRTLGALLGAATLVGVANASLDTAQAYALERHQFGVPIGSFQAIKHLLADVYLRNSVAQSATYAAASMLDAKGSGAAASAVAASKALAGTAAIEGASIAIQVLGGMGFTWDMLPNYLLKRAWVLEHAFGDADHHAHDLGSVLLAVED